MSLCTAGMIGVRIDLEKGKNKVINVFPPDEREIVLLLLHIIILCFMKVYLRIKRRGLEAELVNIGKQGTLQLLADCRNI